MNNNEKVCFKLLFTEKSLKIRENKEILRSFETDGHQGIILKYIDINIVKQNGSVENLFERQNVSGNESIPRGKTSKSQTIIQIHYN